MVRGGGKRLTNFQLAVSVISYHASEINLGKNTLSIYDNALKIICSPHPSVCNTHASAYADRHG